VSHLQTDAAERETHSGGLQSEVETLRAQLVRIQGEHEEVTSTRDSVLMDLDSQRTSLTQAQTELFKTKSEVETLQSERTKQDAAMAELQAKLAEYSASNPSAVEPTHSLGSGPRESLRDLNVRAGSPMGGRLSKPPPPTPPPTAPMPPLPSSLPPMPMIPDDSSVSNVSHSSSGRRSPRSTVTSMDGASTSTHTADPRMLAQLEEQDGTIKNLGRRLQHCEADLQANIDLVNTLEAALNDSERALRKSRLSANGQSHTDPP
jgi:septal ring factor EnvC (AmiA/AmiB activator)